MLENAPCILFDKLFMLAMVLLAESHIAVVLYEDYYWSLEVGCLYCATLFAI